MEQAILIWCVLPALVSMSLVVLVAWLVPREWSRSARGEAVLGGLAGLAFAIATAAALYGRQGVGWWPEDAWQRAVWPVGVGGIVLAGAIGWVAGGERFRWLALAMACGLTAYVTLPTGQGWDDLLPLHRDWMLGMFVCGFLNLWMLDGLAREGGSRWVGLVAVAGLGGAAMLAGASYASLAEWALAGIVAVGVATGGALLSGRGGLWGVVYPSGLLSVSVIASGRFYTYADYPTWLYGSLLLLPSLVGGVDWLLRACGMRERRIWVRVVVAALVACVVLGLAAWKLEPWTLLVGGEEEW